MLGAPKAAPALWVRSQSGKRSEIRESALAAFAEEFRARFHDEMRAVALMELGVVSPVAITYYVAKAEHITFPTEERVPRPDPDLVAAKDVNALLYGASYDGDARPRVVGLEGLFRRFREYMSRRHMLSVFTPDDADNLARIKRVLGDAFGAALYPPSQGFAPFAPFAPLAPGLALVRSFARDSAADSVPAPAQPADCCFEVRPCVTESSLTLDAKAALLERLVDPRRAALEAVNRLYWADDSRVAALRADLERAQKAEAAALKSARVASAERDRAVRLAVRALKETGRACVSRAAALFRENEQGVFKLALETDSGTDAETDLGTDAETDLGTDAESDVEAGYGSASFKNSRDASAASADSEYPGGSKDSGNSGERAKRARAEGGQTAAASAETPGARSNGSNASAADSEPASKTPKTPKTSKTPKTVKTEPPA